MLKILAHYDLVTRMELVEALLEVARKLQAARVTPGFRTAARKRVSQVLSNCFDGTATVAEDLANLRTVARELDEFDQAPPQGPEPVSATAGA